MVKLVKRLWYGEPVFVLAFINTGMVALALEYRWAAVAALVTVPLSAFVARSQVSPNNK